MSPFTLQNSAVSPDAGTNVAEMMLNSNPVSARSEEQDTEGEDRASPGGGSQAAISLPIGWPESKRERQQNTNANRNMNRTVYFSNRRASSDVFNKNLGEDSAR